MNYIAVENLLSVESEEEESEEEAQYHDVVRGDTLSHIAKEYYGNANAYMKIFVIKNDFFTFNYGYPTVEATLLTHKFVFFRLLFFELVVQLRN